MDESGDPIESIQRVNLFDETVVSDHDPEVVAGMQRLELLRETEHHGILEFGPRPSLRPRFG